MSKDTLKFQSKSLDYAKKIVAQEFKGFITKSSTNVDRAQSANSVRAVVKMTSIAK